MIGISFLSNGNANELSPKIFLDFQEYIKNYMSQVVVNIPQPFLDLQNHIKNNVTEVLDLSLKGQPEYNAIFNDIDKQPKEQKLTILENLAKEIATKNGLKIVNLENCNLRGFGIDILFGQGLNDKQIDLTILNLSNTDINWLHTTALEEYLEKKRNLISLDLSHNNLKRLNSQRLANALQRHQGLKIFKINNAELIGDELDSLTFTLSSSSIGFINFGGNPYTRLGLISYLRSLASNSILKYIDFRECELEKTDIERILKILKGYSQAPLTLLSTEISEEEKQELFAKYPEQSKRICFDADVFDQKVCQYIKEVLPVYENTPLPANQQTPALEEKQEEGNKEKVETQQQPLTPHLALISGNPLANVKEELPPTYNSIITPEERNLYFEFYEEYLRVLPEKESKLPQIISDFDISLVPLLEKSFKILIGKILKPEVEILLELLSSTDLSLPSYSYSEFSLTSKKPDEYIDLIYIMLIQSYLTPQMQKYLAYGQEKRDPEVVKEEIKIITDIAEKIWKENINRSANKITLNFLSFNDQILKLIFGKQPNITAAYIASLNSRVFYRLAQLMENPEIEKIASEEDKYYTYFLKMAVDKGHQYAQLSYGDYFNNKGQFSKAFKYYEKAAENDFVLGLQRLAEYYHEGKGYEQSFEKAKKKMKKAADQGYPYAQYEYARYISEKIGMSQEEYKEANFYYGLAMKQNFPQADIGYFLTLISLEDTNLEMIDKACQFLESIVRPKPNLETYYRMALGKKNALERTLNQQAS